MSFQQAFNRCLISVITCDLVFDALTNTIFDLLLIILYKNFKQATSRTTKKIFIAEFNFYNVDNFKLKI